jgi:hypothetical protein
MIKEDEKRLYPDQGLKKVEGEFESSLAEIVKKLFKKIK